MVSHEMPAHIELRFREYGRDVTVYYAVDADTLRSAEIAIAAREDEMSAQALRDWLSNHGGYLDRVDGPAHVVVWPDGMRLEEWYRNGQLHREGAPAFIIRHPDDSTTEVYYSDGQVSREDGPARVMRRTDGSMIEAFYRNGKEIKEERLAPISRVVGGTLYPAVPEP